LAGPSGSVSACVDKAACDLNPTVGIIQVANGALNGVQINGSIRTSTGGAGTVAVATPIGSTITLNWFDDPMNGQGAELPTDTPGNLIHTFTTRRLTLSTPSAMILLEWCPIQGRSH
jgi:hypothetical protein